MVLALKIALPILMAGIVVGLVISLFQTITSIQDQTLTFVPKILSMVLIAATLLPWIYGKLVEYAIDQFMLF